MTYIIFENNKSLEEFEDSVALSSQWLNCFSNHLLVLIANETQAYLETGDDSRLLNVPLKSFNELPSMEGAYDFVLLIYQENYQRLLIFEHSLVYGG